MKRIGKRRAPRRDAFTLFEVLLVLIILIILTSTVSYYVIGAQKKAEVRAAKAQIGLFKSMLTDYHMDCGGYPTTEQGLAALRVAPEGMTKWSGPYAEKDIPNDPWESPFQYQLNGAEYRVWSLGPDRQDGTADDVSSD